MRAKQKKKKNGVKVRKTKSTQKKKPKYGGTSEDMEDNLNVVRNLNS